jgi:ABC-type branched-subunit amino acid transport system substrate-binding protein
MTRSTPTWRTTALLGVSAAALAACGGGGQTSGGTTTQQPTGAATGGQAGAPGDGELVIGTLLPQTGSLAFLGPPEFAGVALAVKDINAAGGVLGKPVRKFDSDSGDTSTNIASQSVQRLFGNKVDAIVGAASSSVTLSVIDQVTGNGVLMFSPANTSIRLTDYDDKGLYFRTAPPDLFQGRVLGNTAAEDGNETLAILALQDAYGEGLATQAEQSFTNAGGEVVAKVIYDPKAANYAAEVSKIKAANPDAIAVIGFDETKKLIPELVKQGVGPKTTKLYFVDGNLADYSKDLPAGTLTGVKGTLPGAESGEALRKRLLEVNPKLTDFSYAPEAYDATVLIALAAEAAKSDAARDIAGKLIDVSKGGEKCRDFKTCKDLLAQGKDIDYDGQSGPIDFDDKGNPSQATMGIYQYGANNKYTNLDYVSGNVSE